MNLREKQDELDSLNSEYAVMLEEMKTEIEPLQEEIARIRAGYDQRKRGLRVQYEALITEILEAKTRHLRNELTVSGVYRCPKSPVRWCVFHRAKEDCLFCGEPEERK